MSLIGDYNQIMSDRKIFNDVVYTPLSEALKILEERRNNPEIVKKINELLKGDIPEVLKNNKNCGVQFRQIATPNYDAQHFISISKSFDLKPTFFEYLSDKFTSNNDFKHSLGQLMFQTSVNKDNKFLIEKINVIDFNKADGKAIKEIKTNWGESLIDFHRKLFDVHNYNKDDFEFYDASEWLKNNGGNASNYYKNIFILFTCYGILFENFLFKDKDGEFTLKVVLPSLNESIKLTGMKPLIVPIGPLDIEDDNHWISYNHKIKNLILNIQL